MKYEYPDLTKLYRLPYTISDNPNVVIEPTAYCNLKCPHCYRKSDDHSIEHAQMSIEEIKKYIDYALKTRNFHTLSFLGGEPLLYPKLDEAITYAIKKGLKTGVYTNGVLLDEQRLREFKNLGLNYVYVHVDRHQNRGDTEDEINKLRGYYCNMFRKVGDIILGFGLIFHEEDIKDIDKIADFLQKNSDVIKFVNFSLFTPTLPEVETDVKISKNVDDYQKKMCNIIQDAFDFEWCCYLGSKYRKDKPGKLMAVRLYKKGKPVRTVDSKSYGKLVEDYHKKHGKYFHISRMDKKNTYFAKKYRSILKIAKDLLNYSVDPQSITISLSPLYLEDLNVVNICDSCQDCVLYENKFVPMCTLEYLKTGSKPVVDSVEY